MSTPPEVSPSADAPPAAAPAPNERVLGRHSDGLPGSTLVVIGGLHGNEPSGVAALRRVLAWLQRRRPPFRGCLLALAGNLQALAAGVRFLDEDLNRVFLPERVAAVRTGLGPTSREAAQQRELLEALHAALDSQAGIFVDLHTSSARGRPFVCIGDTLRNRGFALRFPVPVILGLEEQIDGALLEYVNNLGHVTIGFEAGQHDHPESVAYHEAFVMLALVAAGCVEAGDVPRLEEHRKLLCRAVRGMPPVLEVRYRRPVAPGDGFLMQPGYSNFSPVEAGELLARDTEGPVHAPHRGRVLLPLYQGLGSDGFFIVREVRPLWLRVSAILRRLRADRVVHWLPGVRRDPDRPRTLRVDPRVARWLTVEVFHLLGFRKRRGAGRELTFSRRLE